MVGIVVPCSTGGESELRARNGCAGKQILVDVIIAAFVCFGSRPSCPLCWQELPLLLARLLKRNRLNKTELFVVLFISA